MKPQSQTRSRLAASRLQSQHSPLKDLKTKPQPNSPLKQLKSPPQHIAGEFVNLTSKTVGAFLKTHRWRLLLPTPAISADSLPPGARVLNPETIQWDVDAAGNSSPGEFQGDEREADPETGEPIPGTQRTLEVWKQPETLKASDADVELRRCEKCKTITRHVLGDITDRNDPSKCHRIYVCEQCRNAQMQKVRDKHAETGKRNEESTLLKWSSLLRGMWTREGSAEARQACEQIFAAERPNAWDGNLQRWRETLPLERSAIQIGARGFAFRRRDLLDAVAWTILEASRRGWLRRCKSQCESPLFVASHSRQVYCVSCGLEAEKRRKMEWARKSRAA